MTAQEDLERELTRFLRRARRRSRGLATLVHPDLDAAGYAALVAAEDEGRTGAVRSGDVAGALGLHKSQASRILSGLEELGLISQQPDPDDGRVRLITLTDTGTDALSRARAGRRDEIVQRLGAWPTDDLATLARLLHRLNDDLD